ncbi:MAG TPA: cation-translocating P-type ATPase [Polyangiaceae bacterium]|nr:cation-translocating P-type ATPase [Polyangiaceae bacterium]
MSVVGAFYTLRKLLSPRARRSWVGRTRAHIELRELSQAELNLFVERVQPALHALVRVRGVEINAPLRRLIVSYDDDAYSLSELLAVVEEAERAAGVENAGFRDETWEHPADVESIERLLVGLCADTLGVATGLGLKFSPLPASRIAGTLGSLFSIAQTTTRLRKPLDERFGPQRADLMLDMAAAAAHGAAQRPGSALVDLAHKFSKLGEAQARRRIWEQREQELFAVPASVAELTTPEARPRALPRGPIEEYADRAWIVSLGGFAVSFLTTRSVQRAIAALFAGLPGPAKLGRETYCSELSRALAARQALVVDAEALRRLDRIDCLVLEGGLVARDRYEVRELLVVSSEDEAETRRALGELLDVERPIEKRSLGDYTFGALGVLGCEVPEELSPNVSDLGRRGGLVVGLVKRDVLVALAEVELIPQTGIDELITAAHEAEMRVVVASSDEEVLSGLPADDTIGAGEDLARGIRRLQREGRAVCLVATSRSPRVDADLTIGLMREGEAPPWGAHVICRDDLSDVRFLIHAAVSARQVAKQGVNIALGAATLGALVSAGGVLPLTARRVIAVVNAASLISMANGVRGSFTLARRALPAPRDRTPWYALDARSVLVKLRTSEQGLMRREAQRRKRPQHNAERSRVGELVEAVTDELFNPLAPLLAAGAGLSAAVGSFADAGMVGGVVALNALIGGAQRYRTERRLRELSRGERRFARVRRGNSLLDMPEQELVRGDIVVLEAGDVVPADCRILSAEALEVDASSMTGESLPVRKSPAPSFDSHVADRSSMLYDGTAIAAGRAVAVVVATGDETEARRGAGAVKRDPSRGGVERRLRSLIHMTGPVALGAGVSLIGAGLIRGRKLEDLVGSGVSLAVASVPEGLPLIATAAQLAAASRLSKRGALVRNVRSIEALGRVDALCLDKTGTLTEGRIELGSISEGTSDAPSTYGDSEKLVLAAALRAAPEERIGSTKTDPTDAALYRAARAHSVRAFDGAGGWLRLRELPFEAERGYQIVLGETREGALLTVKGAPEKLIGRVARLRKGGQELEVDEAGRSALLERAKELGGAGLRVLGVAEARVAVDHDLAELPELVFRGFVAFRDPVRPTSAQAVSDLHHAGVITYMLTGDHPSTAEAIAREVGLLPPGGIVMSGNALAQFTDEELDAHLKRVRVFARVTPAQKVRVVRALQRAGKVVAMVGDGANDAPAIRLANVGIAVGRQSTAAARAAADVVLTDERIETLVHAIVEGRAMWASVRDAVSILVGGNLGEIGFTLAAGLLDGRPPLNPRQLLLVNLLTDVAPAMAIALRPPSLDTLSALRTEGPEASLGQPLNRDIALRALVTSLGAGSAWIAGRFGGRERANTVGLLALVGSQLGQTLMSGKLSRPVIITSVASAATLALIVQTPGVSQLFGCKPLGPVGWATAIGASAGATALAGYFPELVSATMKRLHLDKPVMVEDLEALEGAVTG